MHFEISGTKPKSEEGKLFVNTSSFWIPLWTYVSDTDVLSEEHISNGYYDLIEGVEILPEQARKIAEELKEELDSGRTTEYAEERKKCLEALPDEPCTFCKGTGVREFDKKVGICNACHGKLKLRPSCTHDLFSVKNVRKFQKFCEHCGGFTIW
jgi:hypothetical protein